MGHCSALFPTSARYTTTRSEQGGVGNITVRTSILGWGVGGLLHISIKADLQPSGTRWEGSLLLTGVPRRARPTAPAGGETGLCRLPGAKAKAVLIRARPRLCGLQGGAFTSGLGWGQSPRELATGRKSMGKVHCARSARAPAQEPGV